jgi:NADH dehydrogenase
MSKHKLILLGGGFAGTWIATHATAYADRLDIVLISEEPAFTFSPLLINGLAGDLKPQDFTLDLTKLASERGFRFIQGTIELIDRTAQNVRVKQPDGTRLEVAYDSAVLATGAKANFFDIPGLEQASFALKQLADIDRLVAHLSDRLIRASKAWTEEDKRRILSFVIVGGGPSGIEILGAMQERLQSLAYQQGLEAVLPFINITLIESNKLLFYGFPEELSQKSEAVLKEGGISVHCDMRVTGAANGVLTFADQSTLGYGTLIWAAGVKAIIPPVQPPFQPGPLKPDTFLQLDEHLYGAGDAVMYEQNGLKFPKNAQFALQMARDVLTNVLRRIDGKPPIPPRCQYTAALVTVLQTGFFRIGSLVLKGRWVHPFRKLLYRLRLWQIRTGR